MDFQFLLSDFNINSTFVDNAFTEYLEGSVLDVQATKKLFVILE